MRNWADFATRPQAPKVGRDSLDRHAKISFSQGVSMPAEYFERTGWKIQLRVAEVRRQQEEVGEVDNSIFVDVTVCHAVLCGIAEIGKNQRPPAEMASAPSRGHPHTPSSAGGR